jgi:tetratricopeptide (TPR) repeat protein
VGHLERSDGEPNRITEWALAAGQWAFDHFAYNDARRFFELAQGELDARSADEKDRAKELQAQEGLGMTQQLLGDLKGSYKTLQRALESAYAPMERARVLLKLARLDANDLGEYERALLGLNQVESIVVREEPADLDAWLAQILTTRAQVHHWRGEYVQGERDGRSALVLGVEGATANRARYALAMNLQRLGRTREALDLYHAILEKASASGDLPELANAHMQLGNGLQAIGKLGAALAAYEEAGRLYEELGNIRRVSVKELNTGNVLTMSGELVTAEAAFTSAIERAKAVGAPYTAAAAAHQLGLVYALSGRWREAEERFENALGEARALGARVVEAQAHIHYCEYWKLRKDWTGVAKHARAGLDIGGALGDNFCLRLGHYWMGKAALASGDVAAASESARLARELATFAGQVLTVGRVERLLGEVAAARAAHEDALAHFVESEGILREAGAQIELGETLLARARAGWKAGENAGEQQSRLVEARRIFRRSGAKPLWREANELLRR